MEIGARLKEVRETKGISLETLQETTKIQKRYLKAIEGNDFQVLPGKFYTRAFIREYASAVGLDPEQVMEEHKNELPTFEDEGSIQYSRVQKSKKEVSKKSAYGSKIFPTILTVGVIVGVIFVAWVFWQNGNEAENDGSAQQPDSNDEISVPADSDENEEDRDEELAEEEESERNGTETDKDSLSEDSSEQQEEDQPEEQLDVQLTEEGSGGFPEHTYEITGVEERTVTIELTGTAYMEAQSPKGGEDLITAREYAPGDSPITLEIDGNDEFYIKTGNAPGTVVKIKDEEIPFPNPELSTQKLLLQFHE